MLDKFEEINSIHDALKYIRYDNWPCLLLDLDNTVMESILELGSETWVDDLMKISYPSQWSKTTAFSNLIAIDQAIKQHVRVKPVEPKIVIVIKALQSIGFPVVALTARYECMRSATLKQLADIGIDFSKNTLQRMDGTFIQDGIIFCEGRNKGEALTPHLHHCIKQPKCIVMLDDRKKHLERVKPAVEALNIQFIGLRYGFTDNREWDKQKASFQLGILKPQLPAHIQQLIEQLKLIYDTPAHWNESQFMHGFFSERKNRVFREKMPFTKDVKNFTPVT